MRLSAPKMVTWIIALILGVLGILGVLVTIPFISGIAFWIMAVAWALLVLGTYFEGL